MRAFPSPVVLRKGLFPLIVILLAGCSTVPETGRRQLILTNPDAEASEAAAAFDQLKREQKISTNSSYKQRVSRVGQRILKVAPVKSSGWEFVVFEDSQPNAFALPGGKIGVNTGLFKLASDDAMLATVLAHEVAHVVARHGSERRSHGMAAGLGGTLLDLGLAIGTDMSPGTRNAILGAYGAGATVGVILPYSRGHESEADRLGLLYMARAGYNPEAAIQFWEKMESYTAKQSGGKVPAFLSTHPADNARIANLRKYMPEARAEYRKAGGG